MKAALSIALVASLLLGVGCRGDAKHGTAGASRNSLSSPVPSARWGHGLAYDSARGKTVLFGGLGASGFVGDTWEWDSAAGTWTLRATTGPGARYAHAMVYDSVRRKIVLFGGISCSFAFCLLGDTWEWDGAAGTWTLRATTGPPAR